MNKQELQTAFGKIHASEALTMEVLHMKKKRFNFRAVLIAACLCTVTLVAAILAGAELAEPEATRPEDVPTAQIDWTMYGVWVDAQGNVLAEEAPVEFSLQATFYENGEYAKRVRLKHSFTFPDAFRYRIDMPENLDGELWDSAYGPQLTGYPYYISVGYIFDTNGGGEWVWGSWAISLEKECMILCTDREEGRYFVASRKENADAKEIIEYYRWFLDSYVNEYPYFPLPEGWDQN